MVEIEIKANSQKLRCDHKVHILCENWRERKCKCVCIGVLAHGKRMQRYSSESLNHVKMPRLEQHKSRYQMQNNGDRVYSLYTYFIAQEFVGIRSEPSVSPTMNELLSLECDFAHTKFRDKFSAFFLQNPPSSPIVPCYKCM